MRKKTNIFKILEWQKKNKTKFRKQIRKSNYSFKTKKLDTNSIIRDLSFFFETLIGTA